LAFITGSWGVWGNGKGRKKTAGLEAPAVWFEILWRAYVFASRPPGTENQK
jgi:hypothetical protein